MLKYGLIGFPLGHSESPAVFEQFARKSGLDAKFELFPLEHISELPALLVREPMLRGLSVTIPYKELVMPLLDAVETAAATIGAVNTIKIEPRPDAEPLLTGYNTDYIGFSHSIAPAIMAMPSSGALIFGTGGAAKAVSYALSQLGVPNRYVSREARGEALSYEDLTLELIAEHRILVNATPLGMSPITDAAPPIPYEGIGSGHLVFDLIYNPRETLFLSKAKRAGAKVIDGREMLSEQALEAYRIWGLL